MNLKEDIYPLLQLEKLLKNAKTRYSKLDLENYNVAILSTVSKDLKPSSRVILIKGISSNSIIFYTNLNSKKAQEIENNSSVSLVFYWEILKKQVRVEGVAFTIKDNEADDYFKTRPYLSKINAWASKQSKIMKNKNDLAKRVEEYSKKYKEEVPRPPFWSGFRVEPTYLEFWESGKFRMHKRVGYTKTKGQFKKIILYP